MALDWLLEDDPQYVSRGRRIMSVLDGSGSVDLVPGRPDIQASQSDWDKGDKFDPDIEFDPNSYSRIDKFDGLEIGQEYIDTSLDSAKRGKAEPSTTDSEAGGK
ncbi:hypothetical protein [Sigmofec virus UA08Rod_4820]|uniref:Uncharacterized protein n=1 Tax=Sigmofec virus UA08Rod_4820 TaxID=2929410 RepID=A0A976R715_9VIRU|nr:hypothetical protein [Sigmofec virus UA08Rod_4820]